MGFFKPNNSIKKRTYKKIVMHKDGIPNFPNDDSIELVIDEINEKLIFTYRKKNTAALPFSKIIGLETGERGNSTAQHSTGGAIAGAVIGGTTGAIIGSTTGKHPSFLPTLKIKYVSGDELHEINLYQCNYYSEESIHFIKATLTRNIHQKDIESHLEL
jgi:hypothetical protein